LRDANHLRRAHRPGPARPPRRPGRPGRPRPPAPHAQRLSARSTPGGGWAGCSCVATSRRADPSAR
jgi:hypothetical protein